VPGHGREGTHLLGDLATAATAADADDDVGLVDVDPGTAGVEGVHGVLPVDLSPGGQRQADSLLCVLPAVAGATVSWSSRRPGRTLRRADGTNLTPPPSSPREASPVLLHP